MENFKFKKTNDVSGRGGILSEWMWCFKATCALIWYCTRALWMVIFGIFFAFFDPLRRVFQVITLSISHCLSKIHEVVKNSSKCSLNFPLVWFFFLKTHFKSITKICENDVLFGLEISKSCKNDVLFLYFHRKQNVPKKKKKRFRFF